MNTLEDLLYGDGAFTKIDIDEVVTDILSAFQRDDEEKLMRSIRSCVAGVMDALRIESNLDLVYRLGKLYGYGAQKYAEYNWRMVESKRYVAALGRHAHAMESGKIYDDETGIEHGIAVIWNCISLAYKISEGSDD